MTQVRMVSQRGSAQVPAASSRCVVPRQMDGRASRRRAATTSSTATIPDVASQDTGSTTTASSRQEESIHEPGGVHAEGRWRLRKPSPKLEEFPEKEIPIKELIVNLDLSWCR